jgi:hypothetical protein
LFTKKSALVRKQVFYQGYFSFSIWQKNTNGKAVRLQRKINKRNEAKQNVEKRSRANPNTTED